MARLIDVAVNLSDDMFQGEYHGKKAHEGDLEAILSRAWEAGVETIVACAGTLEESKKTLELAKGEDRIKCTVGVHPTRCNEFEDDPLKHREALLEVIHGAPAGKVVAVGECGLDYDRLQFCTKETQLKHFEHHFWIAEQAKLPLFLHNRNTGNDLAEILKKNRDRFSTGVVHSFTGTAEEAQLFLDLDLYIGINGCSLKTQENIDVMKTIPLERMVLETDAPWCEVRPTHAGHGFIKTQWPTKKKEKFQLGECVKNRYEPCHVRQVLEVVAGARGEEIDTVADVVYANSVSHLS